MEVEAPRSLGWRDLLAIALVAAIPLLLRAQVPPVYWWDEARVALNALEMMTSANPLVVTFNGEADLWNTKPPLAIWLSALSMRLFGINELGLRLPALLAALATVLAVFAFTHRVAHSRAVAWLAALILLGTGGYVEVHVARTADFDSLLVLFMTLATFSLFLAIDSAESGAKQVTAAALFLAAAILTKSIAGLLMLPGYALYLLGSGKARAFAGRRAVWLAGAGAAGAMALFMVAREVAEPGFAHAAWARDTARFSMTAEGHGRAWHSYASALLWPWQPQLLLPLDEIPYVRSAFPWPWLAPLALLPLAGLRAPLASRSVASRAAMYLLCCLLAFLIVISAAVSKLPWYVAPAYPLMAVLAALGVHQTRLLFGEESRWGRTALPIAMLLGVVGVACNVWKTEKEIATIPRSVEQRLPDFLRHDVAAMAGTAPLRIVREFTFRTPAVVDGKIVGTEIYDGAVEFYARKLRQQGRKVRVVELNYVRHPGEMIIGCGAAVHDTYRNFRVVAAKGHCFALSEIG